MSDNLILTKGPESKKANFIYFTIRIEGEGNTMISFMYSEENESQFGIYELKTDTIGKV